MTTDESDCIEGNYGTKKEDGWIGFFSVTQFITVSLDADGNRRGRWSVSFHKYSKTWPMMAKERRYCYQSILVSLLLFFFSDNFPKKLVYPPRQTAINLKRKNSSNKTEVPRGWPFIVCIPGNKCFRLSCVSIQISTAVYPTFKIRKAIVLTAVMHKLHSWSCSTDIIVWFKSGQLPVYLLWQFFSSVVINHWR